MWSGPTTDWHSGSPQVPVVSNYSNINTSKRVWLSEDNTHEMRGQAQRYGSSNINRDVSGGMGSPIVSGNRVYLFYYEPTGSIFDTAFVRRMIRFDDTVKVNQWKIRAHEVFVCMDKWTGKTLWKTVLKNRGYIWADQTKNLPANQTAAIGDGKIFSYGSTGRVYCLDALTGQLLWENYCGSRFTFLNNTLNQSLSQFKSIYQASNHGGACFYTDGIFIASCANTYYAFNASTGAQVWTKSNLVCELGNGAFWKKNGKNYLVTAYKGNMALIDPVNGNTLWQINGVGWAKVGLTVSGDYVVLDSGNVSGLYYGSGKYLCYKLDLANPVKMWCRHNRDNFTQFPFIKDGKVFMRCGPNPIYIKIVDLITGDSVGTSGPLNPISYTGCGFETLYDGKYFFGFDGAHDNRQSFGIFNIGPNSLTQISTWNINSWHPNEDSYELPAAHPISDGLWINRGKLGIYTYDIRPDNSWITVSLTQPSSRIKVPMGQTVTLSATANATSGSIAKVEFYADGVLLGTSNTSPYTFPFVAGDTTTVITAKAYTNDNQTKNSYPILVCGRKFSGIKIVPTLKYWLNPLAKYDTNFVEMYFNDRVKFYYQALDQFGEVIPAALTSISGTPTGGGMFNSSTGVFNANLATGQYVLRVTATLQGVTITDSIGLHILKRNQTIQFTRVPNRYLTDPPYKVIAQASSGLAVQFSVISGPASFTQDTIVATGTGVVVIKLSQPGNAMFNPAPEVTDTFEIKNPSVLSKVALNTDKADVPFDGVWVFTAQTFDQYNDLMANPTLTWSVSGGGTVNSEGLFNAGSVTGGPHNLIVKASLGGVDVYDTAKVTIIPHFRTISVNFGTSALGPNDFAGIVSKSNWNNKAAATGTTTNLKDDKGNPTPTDVTTNFTTVYTTADNGTDANSRMFKSYIGTLSNTGVFKVRFDSLPAQFVNNTFDVYAYWQGFNNLNKITRYQVNGQSYFLKDATDTWDGELNLSTATTSAAALQGQEYVKFSGINTDSFTVFISSPNSQRWGISGLQIVTEDNTPVVKQNQTISWSSPGDQYYQGVATPVSLTGTLSSGLPLYYTVVSGPATLSGQTLILTGTGVVVVRAWHPGNEAFNPAESVTHTFNALPKEDQTLTWPDMASPILVSSFPATIPLTATASSGLPVVYTVLSGSAYVNGSNLNIDLDGYIFLEARQPGNFQFNSTNTLTKQILVELATSVDEPGRAVAKKIYPNPTQTQLFLEGYQGSTVRILSTSGKTLHTQSLREEATELDLRSLPKGLYFLQITEGETTRFAKIVKEE